eukprot:Sdes_comp13259_c0_seq1m3124
MGVRQSSYNQSQRGSRASTQREDAATSTSNSTTPNRNSMEPSIVLLREGGANRGQIRFHPSLGPEFLQNFYQSVKARCPVCKNLIDPQKIDEHINFCVCKASLQYNCYTLETDLNTPDCVICFEPFLKGNEVARLPCLCMYHKSCIESWFEKSLTCPEHNELIFST